MAKQDFSAEEWKVRVDLAACYNIVADYGWDDLVFTHITAKVPGTEHFLINPYGMMFDEISASSLVKIDMDGNKVDDSPYDINPAGFTIHSAIHAAREDAKCVLHLHTNAGVAVSAQSDGLLPISQQSLLPMIGLSYHDYEGVALREDEKPRLVDDLGTNNAFILRSHGLLTVGKSVSEAFIEMYFLQRACEIQLLAQAGGGPLIRVPQPILDGAQQMAEQATKALGGDIAWPGILRRLDRKGYPFRA
jgi:ribulose-5-phosphate 4-epimerase/fuculose-1-phosphate aldolase